MKLEGNLTDVSPVLKRRQGTSQNTTHFLKKKLADDTYGSWLQFHSNSHWSVEQIKRPKFMCVSD